MPESANSLERAEKATSLLRNLVIILGGLASVVFFAASFLKGKVEVRQVVVPIAGSKLLITDAGRFAQLTRTASTHKDALSDYQEQIGRLDAAGSITIENRSKRSVHLIVRVKNVRSLDLDPIDVEKGEFMRSHFMLIDVFASCPLHDQTLSIGDGGYIWPNATGTIELKEFPAHCTLRLDLAEVRSSRFLVSVLADGELIQPMTSSIVFGGIGEYATLITTNPPWGYLLALILPLIILVLLSSSVAISIAQRLMRSRFQATSASDITAPAPQLPPES